MSEILWSQEEEDGRSRVTLDKEISLELLLDISIYTI